MKPDESPQTRVSNWLDEINQQASWLPLGAFLIVLLFTPLGRLWWLWLLVVALVFLLRRMTLPIAAVWAAVAIAGGLFTAGGWNGRTLSPTLRDDPEDQQSIDWTGIQRLEIKNFNGDIKILAQQGNGGLRLDRKGDASVSLERADTTLRITARKPFFSFSSGVNMVLTIPESLLVSIQNSNGMVHSSGLIRDLTINNSNGRIEIQDSGKSQVKLESSNGEIQLQRVSGEIKAKTSNAKIRLLQASNLQFNLETSNGSIQLEQLNLENNTTSKVQTSNGSIQLENIQAPSGLLIRGNTNNARVDVNLPGFELRLEDQSFEAKKEGFGQAILELQTSNDRIIVR